SRSFHRHGTTCPAASAVAERRPREPTGAQARSRRRSMLLSASTLLFLRRADQATLELVVRRRGGAVAARRLAQGHVQLEILGLRGHATGHHGRAEVTGRASHAARAARTAGAGHAARTAR